jgi:molybdate transport system substrate-binding protein
MMHRAIGPLVAIGVLVAGGGCRAGGAGAAAQPVLVAAAVSLSTVLEELGAQYTRETRQALRFNFAASNVLARQILEGAAVDVFISADEAQMRLIVDAGLVGGGGRVPSSPTSSRWWCATTGREPCGR